jgi:CheY-like chemotaxis protein
MARILVIDDACWVREVARLTLEAEGYDVRQAADGEEGLREFRRDPADGVLCDLCMPGTDGVETIRQFRQEWPGVPVVAMSGGAARGGVDLLAVARSLGPAASCPSRSTGRPCWRRSKKPFGARRVCSRRRPGPGRPAGKCAAATIPGVARHGERRGRGDTRPAQPACQVQNTSRPAYFPCRLPAAPSGSGKSRRAGGPAPPERRRTRGCTGASQRSSSVASVVGRAAR